MIIVKYGDDAVLIRLREGEFNYGKELTDQIFIDYGMDDEILRIEILNESDEQIEVQEIT